MKTYQELNQELSKQLRGERWLGRVSSLTLVALALSCTTDPTLTAEQRDPLGVDRPGGTGGMGEEVTPMTTGGAVGVLVDNQQPTAERCTATMIGPLFAVTAAHCVQRGAAPARYQIITQSPVLNSAVGARVTEIYIHPLWGGDTTLVYSHLNDLSNRSPSPITLDQTPLYDLALLKVGAPPEGALSIPYGELPNDPQLSFSSVYFTRDLTGERREAELLSANHTNESALSTLLPSGTARTPGGAPAVLSTVSGEQVVGVFAGGTPETGAVYTRLDAHQRFISDARQGITTGDYALGSGEPVITPTPDCATMSDNFCDYGCEGDPDCETPNPVKLKDFGQICAAGRECVSGVCLVFDELNTRCSSYCRVGDCPAGFECREAESGRLVCGTPREEGGGLPPPPPLNYFGADCDNDAQCSTNACISYGEGSKWCSELCTSDDDCPISYVCLSAGNRRACVPPM
jgi:hypothetical protein